MSKSKTKRHRPRKWLVTFYRAVGEFDKNNERRMMRVDAFTPKKYKGEKMAMKRQVGPWKTPYISFRHQQGRRPKKIVEIQVFDESYSQE